MLNTSNSYAVPTKNGNMKVIEGSNTSDDEANVSIEKFVTVEMKGRVFLRPIDSDFKETFFNELSRKIGWNTTLEFEHTYPIELLSLYINEFSDDDVKNLIDEYITKRKSILDESLKSGKIEFDDVPLIFKKGEEVCFYSDGEIRGGIISGVTIENGMFTGVRYRLSCRVFEAVENKPKEYIIQVYIRHWSGFAKLRDLPVSIITPEIKEYLHERGKRFRDVSMKPSYVSYIGDLTRVSWNNENRYRAEGRIMIDPKSFYDFDPDQMRFVTDQMNSTGEAIDDEIGLPDDVLWMASPFVYGFSFKSKRWGRFKVSGVSDIAWRDDAFEKLVLDSETKELIRAIVEYNDNNFTDIIDGKGGGYVFMLHGAPGQGKTLTAESVAEVLHRPLYSVGAGELGTDPDELETRLENILEIVSAWNAVLLLDEADIFLEERNEKDILRNAMVGVFLRLLEYHQGVLFLTTNRVKNIDKAFYSRISICIKFDEADEAKRAKVWNNLISSSGINADKIDVEKLTHYNINSRQIKNAIRLSQTLARSRNVDIDTDLIQYVINFNIKFLEEIN